MSLIDPRRPRSRTPSRSEALRSPSRWERGRCGSPTPTAAQWSARPPHAPGRAAHRGAQRALGPGRGGRLGVGGRTRSASESPRRHPDLPERSVGVLPLPRSRRLQRRDVVADLARVRRSRRRIAGRAVRRARRSSRTSPPTSRSRPTTAARTRSSYAPGCASRMAARSNRRTSGRRSSAWSNWRPASSSVGWVSSAASSAQTRAAHGAATSRRGSRSTKRARTIQIRLREPDADFMHKLAQPIAYVVPADSPPRLVPASALPGTGPYHVADFAPRARRSPRAQPHFRSWSDAARPDGFADEIVVVDRRTRARRRRGPGRSR